VKARLPSINFIQATRYLFLICAAALVVNNSHAADANGIEVKDAWIREAPPNAKLLGAYFTISNLGKQAKTLTSISSSAFEKVEMHKTVKKGDMSNMVEQKELLLKAGESVKFSPGGYHLMLIHPKSVIKVGQHHDMTLYFTDQSTLKLSFPVKKGHAMDEHRHDEEHNMEHQHQHMHNM